MWIKYPHIPTLLIMHKPSPRILLGKKLYQFYEDYIMRYLIDGNK